MTIHLFDKAWKIKKRSSRVIPPKTMVTKAFKDVASIGASDSLRSSPND